MGWLRLVGSLQLWVSFAKESCKTDDILQWRPMILRSLLIVATTGGVSHRDICYDIFATFVAMYVATYVAYVLHIRGTYVARYVGVATYVAYVDMFVATYVPRIRHTYATYVATYIARYVGVAMYVA